MDYFKNKEEAEKFHNSIKERLPNIYNDLKKAGSLNSINEQVKFWNRQITDVKEDYARFQKFTLATLKNDYKENKSLFDDFSPKYLTPEQVTSHFERYINAAQRELQVLEGERQKDNESGSKPNTGKLIEESGETDNMSNVIYEIAARRSNKKNGSEYAVLVRALELLNENNGMLQKDIATETGLSPGTITGLKKDLNK